MTTPQLGDRVRWTRPVSIEGVLDEVTVDGYRIRDKEGRVHLCQAEGASVEVLERADDPSANLVGSLRREDHDDKGFSLHAADAAPTTRLGTRWHCIYSTAPGNVGELLSHEEVAGFPVVGSLPGTPAAEAVLGEPLTHLSPPDPAGEAAEAAAVTTRLEVRVPNEPHGLPEDLRKKVAAHLVDGRIGDAIREVLPMFDRDEGRALSYIGSMSEYQTYLTRNAPRRVIVLPGATEDWAPDREVLVWEWLGADDNGWRFLHRNGDGYLWDKKSEPMAHAEAAPNTWYGATRHCLGEYREVWS